MIKTPFKKKSLTATKNGLTFDGVDDTVQILTDGRYAFGQSDFSISLIVSVKNPGDDPIFLEMYNAVTNALIRCQLQSGAAQLTLYTDQGNNTTFSSAVLNNPSLFRFTIIRRGGGTIELWINEKLANSSSISAPDSIDFNDTGGHYSIGSRYNPAGNMLQGFVSGLLIFNKAITPRQLSYIHLNNVVPIGLHLYVIAHYPLNHNHGADAFDVIEQYNYAKYINVNDDPLDAADWTFITNDILTTSTATNGTDGDGDYVEFEFLTFTGSGYALWRRNGIGVLPNLFWIAKMRIKIIGSPSGISFTLDNGADHSLTDAVYGNSVFDFTISQFVAPSGNNLFLAFANGFGSKAVGSKVRIYSLSMMNSLSANNGSLLNYTSDGLGDNNLLTQSAWANLYKKATTGEYFLKFDNAGKYANIPTLTAYTSGSSWALAFVITKPRDISSFKALFSNQMTAHDNSNAIIIALYNFGPYTYMAGGVNNPSVTDNFEYCDKPFVVIVYSNPTESAIIWQGTKYAASPFTPPSGWEYFVFGRDRDVHFGDPGLSKAVFIDHTFTTGDIRLLENMHQSDDYKRIVGIKFDIDFAKLFTTGGDWFATDESGLSHHAKLFGFAIDDTEVVKMERDTFLPTRNALRFTAANSNYLKVSAFAPTDEAGYTYIIGFCLPSNRAFANEYFLAKRKPDNTSAKLLFTGTSKVLGFLNYSPALSISDPGICNNDFTNYDTSKPLFFVGKEFNTNSQGLPFGFFEANIAKNPFGWDDALGTALFIGSDDQIYGGSGFLDGYIFHVSIYKGILSKKQIFDIVNNGLGANPFRIPGGCELYLNFENLSPGRVLFDVDGPTSGHVVASGTPIVTYGTDADGDYCQFEYSGYAPAEVIYFYDPSYVVRTVDARFLLRVKVVSATIFHIAGFAYDTHGIPLNGNVIQDLIFIENPSFAFFTFQYQSAFSTAGETIRIYKMHAQEIPTLKDYSPQNRIVQLYNFTDADLTKGDPDYKLFSVDSLR
jgi:hypothetical protein